VLSPLIILVAEDDDNDALLLRLAFSEAEVTDPIHFVRDGKGAIDYLSGLPPFDDRAGYPLPSLLLLDLKMPGVNGFEVLDWLSKRHNLAQPFVVVLSGSGCPSDVHRAYALGANCYIIKPVSFEELVGVIQSLKEERSLHPGMIPPSLLPNQTWQPRPPSA
jgi:CheY-like chemotaxis protein